jgi:hypothetical protein
MGFESWWKENGTNMAMQRIEVVKSLTRAAWQASRDNQQEYQKYGFCRDIGCAYAPPSGCKMDAPGCVRTAKEFHHWLKENGYRIVKGEG